ncbi:class A beta-lactamase-related serine hydrolase [Halobacillus fulvus]|nr:class A beta-lactamase-related serine hydrolase [Halobacillus fulvus]
MIQNVTHPIDFSGVVYVKRGEETLANTAFGYADRAEKRLNTPDTRFGSASGSKLFTVIGIAQLVDKGLIAFDTRLTDCLAIDFPNFDPAITIHHLLTHTSGIPDYFDEEVMEDFEDLWKERPVYQMTSPEDFLPLFQEGAMQFEPGERFHYNNAGFILLGLIIEEQTGRAFSDYIESEVFCKCGMSGSGYFELDQLPQNTALGYIDEEEDKAWRTNVYSIPKKGGADGGAFVTAPDMAKLWEALFNDTLLNEETTRELLTPRIQVNEAVHHGYGIWMNKKGEEVHKYHVMGYDPGVRFRAAYYPHSSLKIVVLSNAETELFDLVQSIEENLRV